MVATGVPGRKKTMPPRHLREAVVPGGQFRSRPRSIAICTLKYQRPRASLSKARCLEVVVAWPSGVAPLRLPLGRGALVPGVVCRTGHAAQELGARLVLDPIACTTCGCPATRQGRSTQSGGGTAVRWSGCGLSARVLSAWVRWNLSRLSSLAHAWGRELSPYVRVFPPPLRGSDRRGPPARWAPAVGRAPGRDERMGAVPCVCVCASRQRLAAASSLGRRSPRFPPRSGAPCTKMIKQRDEASPIRLSCL
jgi:hypothetical protein